MNLASNLVSTASSRPGSIALRVGETATTYQELDQLSARVGGLLRDRGPMPGDQVGIMLPNAGRVLAGTRNAVAWAALGHGDREDE